MERRRLGRTGLDLSAVALGTNPLGRPRCDRNEELATIARALERGVNAIELDAKNEAAVALLREALAGSARRHDAQVLARAPSLVPFDLPSPHIPVQQAYPGALLRAETERLLRALRVERLGLMQLHAWCPEWLEEGDWRETLSALVQEGKIAGFGVSLFDHDIDAAATVIASGAIGAVQVMLNIFDQAALPALLPFCGRHDVGVIARSPLYYGALSEGAKLTGFAPDDWRHDYFYPEHAAETAERVARLAPLATPDLPLPEVALRYALSQTGVATVAVGLRSRAQLDVALAAAEHGPLEPPLLKQLRAHAWLC